MKKKLTLLLLAIVLLASVLALSACVKDKGRAQFVYDGKDIFDEAQEAQIGEACQAATKKYNVTFLVATCNRTGTKADQNGEQFLAANGLSEADDYIILILNAKGQNEDYHFDIYTFGNAYRRLSDEEIEDAVWSTYADRILTSDSATAVSGIEGMLPMLGSSYDGIPLWLNVVLGIGIGLAVALGIVIAIAHSYSRKRKNETYPLDKYCNLTLKDREDTYMRSTTTVVVIRSDSGGGGHSGSGFSSGGGGGGGHRGGR